MQLDIKFESLTGKSSFGALGISAQGFFILTDFHIRIICKDLRRADSGKLYSIPLAKKFRL
jgi:hypothetical protein